MSVNFDQSQLESDLHQSGHPEQFATDNEEIGKYSPDEVDAGRPADRLPAVEQNCPPDSVREEALQTNDVQPQLGDAILPGGLKYGGTNFYKHEFAEKLCRSLPFIKSEPKHRVLKDWATDTEIFPQLGVSMNIQIKKEFDESGGTCKPTPAAARASCPRHLCTDKFFTFYVHPEYSTSTSQCP